jgi:hypothetical protein
MASREIRALFNADFKPVAIVEPNELEHRGFLHKVKVKPSSTG